MKSKLVSRLLIFVSTGTLHLSAQTTNKASTGICNEYTPVKNDAYNPCISPEEYRIIEQEIKENYFHDNSFQRTTSGVLLNWPLKAAGGLNDCSYFFIAAHVDQDTNATTFKDYNCGSLTYDGHRGTDLGIVPFPFYKMDNNEVQVVAAAAGTIINKHDGEYDRNCVGAGSNLTANYIIVQHSDGSVALYWHMKKNSLTSKTTGQSVSTGEFLGIVGSSGSSSGPHLHFEVWSGSTQNTLIDPYAGTCNHLNGSSWWAAQKSYGEAAPIKASVHTTDIVFPACGITETPNESTSYSIPFQGAGLSPGYAKFYVFLRRQDSGTTVSMSILNPNSTVYASWTYNATSNFKFSYLNYSKLLPTIQGTYTFNATYNGITCTQSFDILNPTGIPEESDVQDDFTVYPNPANSIFTIHFNRELSGGDLIIYNTYGQTIRTLKNVSGNEITLNMDHPANGVYFIRITQDNKITGAVKPFIIQSF